MEGMMKLAELREGLNLTQSEFANIINNKYPEENLTKRKISTYENGNAEPSLKLTAIFSDFFNVSIDYLLGNSKTVWDTAEETTRKLEEYKKELDAGNNMLIEELKKTVLNTVFTDPNGNKVKLSEGSQEEIIRTLTFGMSMAKKQAENKIN